MAWFTGLNAKADAAGFLAVYPDGRGSRSSVYWNGGNCRGSAVGGRVMRRQRVECASHPLDAGIRPVSNGPADGIGSSMMPMVPSAQGRPMKRGLGDGSHPRSALTRRECLQVGYSGILGAAIPSLAPRPQAGPKARSVILIFLTGGPCQLDTFDPKPEAPSEIRGGLGAIRTRADGLLVSAMLPELAVEGGSLRGRADHGIAPGLAVHELATPLVLGGIDALPPGAGLAATRNDWPCYAAGLASARPRRDGLPHGVALPRPISNYAGQDAGLLGARYDPWQLDLDPTAPDAGPEKVGLSSGTFRRTARVPPRTAGSPRHGAS